MRLLLLFLLAAAPAQAQAQDSITVLERRELPVAPSAAAHKLVLTLVTLDGAGWRPATMAAAAGEAARILAQCGVALQKLELVLLRAPVRFRDFYTPLSRELASTVPLAKPAIYFVAGTRQRPAFDAEAIGRGNSSTRPELRDTVWVTQGAPDLGIVLAHELAHVLMDSGEHTREPGNLMREDTAPGNTRLSEAQCARLGEAGAANGLLH